VTNPEGSAGAKFGDGVAVSTSGTTTLVSAPDADLNRGCLYVFRVADEGSWISTSTASATLHNSGSRANDTLGLGLALSSDGATALAGAPGVRYETGAADVFNVADPSSWVSTTTPTAILTNAALNRCVVPKLKGKTILAAKAALRARSCRLGRVRRVVAPGRRGHIVRQSPKPGSRLPVGAKVAVWVKK
jgi:hypothetical protein